MMMMMMMMMHYPKPRIIIPGTHWVGGWDRGSLDISLSIRSRTPVASLQAVALPPLPTFRLIKSRGMGWEWNPEKKRKIRRVLVLASQRKRPVQRFGSGLGRVAVECEGLSCCRRIYVESSDGPFGKTSVICYILWKQWFSWLLE
jgi:hypothetical protein